MHQNPKRVPAAVLADLRSGSLSELAPKFEFWKGMVLGSQGDPVDHLFIIAEGQVLLSRRDPDGGERPIYLLGPGDLFGEGSLRPDRRWLVNVRSVSDGSAHRLPASHLPRLAQYYPQLTAYIVGLLAERLERAHSRLDLVRAHSARDRLLGLIHVLAEHHGERQGDRTWVPIHLTQEELGGMIGLARETVARLLGELADEGVIGRERAGLWLLPAAS